jgi:hypothetical protein
MENRVEVPQKSENITAIWSSNLTTEYTKGNKSIISKRKLHSHVYCSTIHYSQDIELAVVTINGWMDKQNVIYIYIYIYIYTHIYIHTHIYIYIYIYTHQNIIWTYKRMQSCHLQQQSGTEGHYVKWNKPDTNILCSHLSVEGKEVVLIKIELTGN